MKAKLFLAGAVLGSLLSIGAWAEELEAYPPPHDNGHHGQGNGHGHGNGHDNQYDDQYVDHDQDDQYYLRPGNPGPQGRYGRLEVYCQGGNRPRVYLRWERAFENLAGYSNSLQKGDLYPRNPNRFWDFISNDQRRNDFTDSDVQWGEMYSYRVKYTPNIVSNIATIRINQRSCQ